MMGPDPVAAALGAILPHVRARGLLLVLAVVGSLLVAPCRSHEAIHRGQEALVYACERRGEAGGDVQGCGCRDVCLRDGRPRARLDGVLLVCGGRDFASWTRLVEALDRVAARMTIRQVRHGAARGADALVDRWARLRGLPVDPVPARWREHGRAAGALRNAEMLSRRPAVVAAVAFPGGAGTADMVRRLAEAGVPTWRPR